MENAYIGHTKSQPQAPESPGHGKWQGLEINNIAPVGLLGVALLTLVALFGGAGAPLEAFSGVLLLSISVIACFIGNMRVPSLWLWALLGLGAALLTYMAVGLWPAVWPTMAGHPALLTLEPLGLTPQWPSLGMAGPKPLPGILLLVAYYLTLVWLLRAAVAEKAALLLLRAVAVVGALFAAYGLWVWVTGNQQVMWLTKTIYTDSLSGSFISRNHAATFLGLGLLACLALALQRVGEISRQLPLMQRLKALWLLVLRPGAGWWLLVALHWFALILTSSRAGLGATMAAILIFFGALAWARAAIRWWLLAGTALLAMLGLLVLAVAGGQVAERASELAYGDSFIRAAINQLSTQAVALAPTWGHGYGAWGSATALVRTPATLPTSTTDLGNAHNLYLQTLTELGWAGWWGVLLLGGVALACLLHGLGTRRRQVVFPAVGLAALVLVGVHSAVDFPLHIPAVMLAFLMLLAPALAQSFKQPEAPFAVNWRSSLVRRGLGGGLASLALCAAVGMAYVQWPGWQATNVVEALKAGENPPLLAMQQARQHLTQCTERAPWLTWCRDDLSLLYLSRAGQLGPYTLGGQIMLKAAQIQGQRSLASAPANPIMAYRLARIFALQNSPDMAQKYLAHSVLMGPYEPLLAQARAGLLVRALNSGQLSTDDKEMFASNLRGLWQQNSRKTWRNIQPEPNAKSVLAQAFMATGTEPENWEKITKTPWNPRGPVGSTPNAQ